MFRTLAFATLLSLGVVPALADDIKAGDLTIQTPWARATPKGAPVGAGYVTIRNDGATPDKLSGGTADFAQVEIHEMSMVGGVMKMREINDGLTIPAHGSVTLAPGGFHFMFVKLKSPLVKGEPVKATLSFEHAGNVEVTFDVREVGAAAPKAGETGGAKM
jgi:periplasmic copper chaperone A